MSTPIEILLDTADWKPVPRPPQCDNWKPGDLPYATYEGVLKFCGIELRCAHLNTGERVFIAEDLDLEKLFGGLAE